MPTQLCAETARARATGVSARRTDRGWDGGTEAWTESSASACSQCDASCPSGRPALSQISYARCAICSRVAVVLFEKVRFAIVHFLHSQTSAIVLPIPDNLPSGKMRNISPVKVRPAPELQLKNKDLFRQTTHVEIKPRRSVSENCNSPSRPGPHCAAVPGSRLPCERGSASCAGPAPHLRRTSAAIRARCPAR